MNRKGWAYGLAAGFLMLAITACRDDSGRDNRPEVQEAPDSLLALAMTVWQPQFFLREAPGENARPIRPLPVGAVVYSMEESSGFTTRLLLDGRAFNEPWILVQTQDGQQGWAYGAAFISPEGEEASSTLSREQRMSRLFGPPLQARIQRYTGQFHRIDSHEKLALAFRECYQLRDALLPALTRDDRMEENFRLLDGSIPGMAPYLDSRQGYCHLFLDFRVFYEKAQTTSAEADGQLIEAYLTAYPEDSIEFFFPGWSIQADEDTGHSLLGRGLHFTLLEKLDKLLVFKDLFGQEIDRLSRLIINDMVSPDVTYWETQENATAELDRILEAGFSLLSGPDKAALESRRRQFQDPEKHGIQFDHRSGIYKTGGTAPPLSKKDK